MATRREGNAKGSGVAPVTDYGVRAAAALNELLPPQHRDKTVARMFDCSVRFAKYLRQGRFWTAERLSQASRALGSDFDMRLAVPEAFRVPTTLGVHERLDALEAEIVGLRQQLRDGGNE